MPSYRGRLRATRDRDSPRANARAPNHRHRAATADDDEAGPGVRRLCCHCQVRPVREGAWAEALNEPIQLLPPRGLSSLAGRRRTALGFRVTTARLQLAPVGPPSRDGSPERTLAGSPLLGDIEQPIGLRVTAAFRSSRADPRLATAALNEPLRALLSVRGRHPTTARLARRGRLPFARADPRLATAALNEPLRALLSARRPRCFPRIFQGRRGCTRHRKSRGALTGTDCGPYKKER